LGYDVIPEEPTNVSGNSDVSVASTNNDIGQNLNRQLDFDGGNKKQGKTKKKRRIIKKTKKK